MTAGLVKASSVTRFGAVLLRFPISRNIVHSMSSAIPAAGLICLLEATTGSFLLLGLAITPVSLFALAMLTGFTAAVLLAVWRKERLSCGCFGGYNNSIVGLNTVVRNSLLAAMLVVGVQGQRLSLQGVFGGHLNPYGFLVSMSLIVQVLMAGALVAGLVKLRSTPGYVRHVPISNGPLGVAWMGAPESRTKGRRRLHNP